MKWMTSQITPYFALREQRKNQRCPTNLGPRKMSSTHMVFYEKVRGHRTLRSDHFALCLSRYCALCPRALDFVMQVSPTRISSGYCPRQKIWKKFKRRRLVFQWLKYDHLEWTKVAKPHWPFPSRISYNTTKLLFFWHLWAASYAIPQSKVTTWMLHWVHAYKSSVFFLNESSATQSFFAPLAPPFFPINRLFFVENMYDVKCAHCEVRQSIFKNYECTTK